MIRRGLMYSTSNIEKPQELAINCCSFNIKTQYHFNISSDQSWGTRKSLLIENDFFNHPTVLMWNDAGNNMIGYYGLIDKLDIIGFQEVLSDNNGASYSQYNDLISMLPGYNNVAGFRGITDDVWDDEACVIFWRSDRFSLYSNGKFWLSSTANNSHYNESHNWVGEKRICVWAILVEKKTKQKILVLNTHLPSYNTFNSAVKRGEAQRWSLNVIRKEINNILGSINDCVPVILLGDFNCNSDTKTGSGTEIISSLIGDPRTDSSSDPSLGTPYHLFNTTNYGSKTILTSAGQLNNVGQDYTMASYDGEWGIKYSKNMDPFGGFSSKARFDYIFLSRWPMGYNSNKDSNSEIWCGHNVLKSCIAAPGIDDNRMWSDHCPVISQIIIHYPEGWWD